MRRIVDSLPDAAAGPNGKEALLACLGKDRRFLGIVPYTFVYTLNRAELWRVWKLQEGTRPSSRGGPGPCRRFACKKVGAPAMVRSSSATGGCASMPAPWVNQAVRVQGSGFRVQGLGFRVWGLGGEPKPGNDGNARGCWQALPRSCGVSLPSGA